MLLLSNPCGLNSSRDGHKALFCRCGVPETSKMCDDRVDSTLVWGLVWGLLSTFSIRLLWSTQRRPPTCSPIRIVKSGDSALWKVAWNTVLNHISVSLIRSAFKFLRLSWILDTSVIGLGWSSRIPDRIGSPGSLDLWISGAAAFLF